ncbi:MAG: hypothetical protein JWQ25_2305 [Daejeonella sp.]|nr:hypothetical protein [Daejeonella sp.]
MILVPNHQLLSSGNKLVVGIAFAILLAACSPKTTIVKIPDKVEPVKAPSSSTEKIRKSISKSSVALILPFYLNTINPKTASSKDIGKRNLAIDFYQGFKLALDSLSSEGYNFNLKVFDSQDQETRIVNLARAKSVLENDLIIGPIFPKQIKAFGEFAELNQKLQVSPLAASMPTTFNNEHLVTVNNTIDQHAWEVASFIVANYKPADINVVLINTQNAEDSKFANPVKKYLKNLSQNKITFAERPNAKNIESALLADKSNLIIIASDEVDFILPTINRLYILAKNQYRIELFGHPNWIKIPRLDTEKLQWLNTHLTASYFIDYTSNEVKQFIARYRDEFSLEPSEFAFKGFDDGYYFGRLLAKYGSDYIQYLSTEPYQGLHNSFHFKRDGKVGFINMDVMMLQYNGFELQKIK